MLPDAPLAEVRMRIEVRGLRLKATNAIVMHIQRRLGFALERFGERVRDVGVRFEDVNGPRGGQDKQCRIYAALAPRGQLTITETDRDLYSAVTHSATRLKRVVRQFANYRPKNRRQARYRRFAAPAHGSITLDDVDSIV